MSAVAARGFYVRNNQYGGIEMVQSETPLPGFAAITLDQHKALLAAPLGTTLDAKGNHIAPRPRSAAEQQVLAYRASRRKL